MFRRRSRGYRRRSRFGYKRRIYRRKRYGFRRRFSAKRRYVRGIKRTRRAIRKAQPTIWAQGTGLINVYFDPAAVAAVNFHQLNGAAVDTSSVASARLVTPIQYTDTGSGSAFPTIRTGRKIWLKGFQFDLFVGEMLQIKAMQWRFIMVRYFDETFWDQTFDDILPGVSSMVLGKGQPRYCKVLVDRMFQLQRPTCTAGTPAAGDNVYEHLWPRRIHIRIRRRFRKPVCQTYDTELTSGASGNHTYTDYRHSYNIAWTCLPNNTDSELAEGIFWQYNAYYVNEMFSG